MKSQPRFLLILDVITAVLMLIATYMVFFYAPQERVMGDVQRVFYFHVSAGWVGMLGFAGALVAGIVYLITRKQIWDLIGLSAIEIGLTFMLINIITGSIWARPIWNTWWTWDPRLTTATIMELVYAAYLMLRQGIEDPDRRARFGAVYAIIGFISVPINFLLDPHLPHHPPGGDWWWRPNGQRLVQHDPGNGSYLCSQPDCFLISVCLFALEPCPPWPAWRSGRANEAEIYPIRKEDSHGWSGEHNCLYDRRLYRHFWDHGDLPGKPSGTLPQPETGRAAAGRNRKRSQQVDIRQKKTAIAVFFVGFEGFASRLGWRGDCQAQQMAVDGSKAIFIFFIPAHEVECFNPGLIAPLQQIPEQEPNRENTR